MSDEPVTLTIRQLAERAQCSEVTIYNHIKKGALRAVKQGPWALRIPIDEAERYLGVPITPGKQF